MIRPVNRNRVSDEVLVNLVRMIVDGVFLPGEKLPPERDLAQQFNINRGSLREALRRLESMGIVSIRQGGGIHVLELATHAGMEFVSFLIQHGIHLNKKLILDMAEMRILFGKMLITLAAKRITDESLQALTENVENISKADMAERYTGKLDFAFYYELAKATGNQVNVVILNTVRDVMCQVIGVYFQVENNPKTSIALYRGILKALSAKDEKKALRLYEKQARKDDALLAKFVEGME